jgi:hypothetical protein
MLRNGVYPGIATHDRALVDGALALIDRYDVPRNRYEFQMLYGVTPELRRSHDRCRAHHAGVCPLRPPLVWILYPTPQGKSEDRQQHRQIDSAEQIDGPVSMRMPANIVEEKMTEGIETIPLEVFSDYV